MKRILYIIAACASLLTACEKGTLVETTEYEKIELGDPKYSYLKILNLTPGSPVVNYYLDGTKFSSGLSSTGVENAGFGYNGLYPDLGYAVTSPGTHALTGKIIPSAAADPNLGVLDQQIAPEAGKYYTIFTTGVYTLPDKKIPSLFMLEDTKPALDTSKVFLRLVNLYNGSPNLDLVKDAATGTKIISDVGYSQASGWTEIPNIGPGVAVSVKLYVNDAATGSTLVAAGFTGTVTKGRAYTIYLRGVLGNTTYPLSIGSYTTFY
ncbi:DUF4397 domain-containing protein [Pedobacter ginsengisoli]|uniref:DUF4397 domain-containing protein n=1 Tax=Pedobacter ginsengisoli TaxID=363852 RepID=UPI0025512D93|nr:DUF4397 domain-containing protein [Pedobacter ginsengisoli]